MHSSIVSKPITIRSLQVSPYTVPTDFPESDGTLEWDRTTIVIVEAEAGGVRGIGYSYADVATALLIRDRLSKIVLGRDALDVSGAWAAMVHAIRNLGRPGIASMAIAAVDACLWDLKARLLSLPLAKLLGMVRPGAPIYGSGGFTSYSTEQLQQQLGGWVSQGITAVKMKVGRNPAEDPLRVSAARDAIGPANRLFVDANGAYTRKQALALAHQFADSGVSWFEEPVRSGDVPGLRLLRDRAPAGTDIAAGEYGYDAPYFLNLLNAGAVDVLQADATRCAGITGFLQAAALCEAFSIPLSAHTAPSLHLPLGCAVGPLLHLEYFYDHVRIERMFFDGVAEPVKGVLYPDLTRPGFGLELREADASRYQAAA